MWARSTNDVARRPQLVTTSAPVSRLAWRYVPSTELLARQPVSRATGSWLFHVQHHVLRQVPKRCECQAPPTNACFLLQPCPRSTWNKILGRRPRSTAVTAWLMASTPPPSTTGLERVPKQDAAPLPPHPGATRPPRPRRLRLQPDLPPPTSARRGPAPSHAFRAADATPCPFHVEHAGLAVASDPNGDRRGQRDDPREPLAASRR